MPLVYTQGRTLRPLEKTSGMTVELFAGNLLESGVCVEYCCQLNETNWIESVPRWSREGEIPIVNDGATPLRKRELVNVLVKKFEENI